MSLKSPLSVYRSSLRNSITFTSSRQFLRYASLNSAIGRGIRRSQSVEDPRSTYENRDRSRSEKSSSRSRDNRDQDYGRDKSLKPDSDDDGFSRGGGGFRGLPREYQRPQPSRRSQAQNSSSLTDRRQLSGNARNSELQDRRRPDQAGRVPKDGYRRPPQEFDEEEFIRTGNFRGVAPTRPQSNNASKARDTRDFRAAERDRSPRHPKSSQETSELSQRPNREEKAPRKQKSERVREHVKVPDTIPYTTPASEFIYGTSAVEAALRCTQRQLYKLYLYQSAEDQELGLDKAVLRKLALAKNVKVKMAFAEWDRLLDKMSTGRPHNGCILEASPLPRTPIQALKPVKLEDDHFRLELAPQTREEAAVNGTDDRITINQSITQQHKRYPVVLLLDGVVDLGNLGAIIRSAYYLGVDAVVFAGRNSAPLSPVTIKASAGAAENMTLLDVKNEVDFIQRSRANGWRFYAADALSPDATYLDPTLIHKDPPTATPTLTPGEGEGEGEGKAEQDYSIGHSPSVIMMGNEGSGLSHHIKSHADAIVSIPGARFLDPARVDSLNVSVAAALLMETFLRVPLGLAPVHRKVGRR
ncbi:uncharacterized protein BDV17DRAFT_253645 [Aspergillus undulatus]|uniref:uncharacterized protein n=1 Tax=Aspergillus undulatus TaxID=1810928 RepID=UPI003CCE2833